MPKCPQDHEYSRENTYVDKNGYKHCRTCRRERMRERRPSTVGQGYHNAVKTHCPHGHEYSEENTWLDRKGSRHCRTCARLNGMTQNIKRYGITREDVDRMLEEQDSKCAICLDPLDPPHIDHDHKCCPMHTSCGKCIRGLLCRDCNRMLGQAHDNPERLRAAAAYLEAGRLGSDVPYESSL